MSYTTGGVSTSTNRKVTTPEILAAADGVTTSFPALQLSSPAIFLLGVKVDYTVSSSVFLLQLVTVLEVLRVLTFLAGQLLKPGLLL